MVNHIVIRMIENLAESEFHHAKIKPERNKILHFINIGHHRIEGWVSTQLYLSQTWSDYHLRGEIDIQDGVYENYYTGTHLKRVNATAAIEGKIIEITSLDGMYRFNLMDQEVFGPYILCKTSMWYPFNFKKVD